MEATQSFGMGADIHGGFILYSVALLGGHWCQILHSGTLSKKSSITVYSETSLNWPTVGPSIDWGGRFRELEYHYNVTVWDPSEAIDIEEWSICRGGSVKEVLLYYDSMIYYNDIPDYEYESH